MSVTIYTMHPSVDYLLEDPEVLKQVNSHIVEDDIVDLTTPLAFIDENCITENMDPTSFFRGLTIANLKEVRQANASAYLNPFCYGLLQDTDYTLTILGNLGFEYTFKTIIVDYDVYSQAFEKLYDEDDPIYQAYIDDQEIYQATNESIKDLVQRIELGDYAEAVNGETFH